MWTLLLLGFVSVVADTSCISSVAIRPTLPDQHYRGLIINGPQGSETTVELDLAETVEGYEVLVTTANGCGSEYRVQWQFETSVSVMNEGPHLDLLEWKHHTGPWSDINPDSTGRYWLPAVTREQSSRFPAVTVLELVEAVRSAGGERWAQLVADVTGPHDYPSTVGISAYRVRVVVRSDDEWLPVHSVDFRVPMGC